MAPSDRLGTPSILGGLNSAELPLAGGRTSAGVVRVGNTARRPVGPRSPFVHKLLSHLAAKGFHGAPQFLGIDEQSREILSFMPGRVPSELGPFSATQIHAAARLLRAFHDATSDFELGNGSEVVCHGDASPCNAVFCDELPYAWIDFDDTHFGSRIEDLGYAAWLWLDIGNDEWTPMDQYGRLNSFFAAYGEGVRCDPVDTVLDAQMKQCDRVGASEANRLWARECRDWTAANLRGNHRVGYR